MRRLVEIPRDYGAPARSDPRKPQRTGLFRTGPFRIDSPCWCSFRRKHVANDATSTYRSRKLHPSSAQHLRGDGTQHAATAASAATACHAD